MDSIWTIVWTAIGAIAALFSAIAAFNANRAASRSEEIAKQSVDAARRQTQAAAIQRLLEKYSSHEMYVALLDFGKHVHDPENNFDSIRKEFESFDRLFDPNKDLSLDIQEALRRVRDDPKLDSGRRLIQHYFKLVWAYRRAGVLSDNDLLLATREQAGYDLWLKGVLPISSAIWHGLASRNRDSELPQTETWPGELINWIRQSDATQKDTRS